MKELLVTTVQRQEAISARSCDGWAFIPGWLRASESPLAVEVAVPLGPVLTER